MPTGTGQARLTPAGQGPHNVSVRARLTLVAVALAILVVAGLRSGDQRASMLHGARGSSALAGPPAPDPWAPALANAALTSSTTAQTLSRDEWSRRLGNDPDPALVIVPAIHLPDGTTRPLTFPLLI